MLRRTFVAGLAAVGGTVATGNLAVALSYPESAGATAGGSDVTNASRQHGYAPVNGIDMYYEVHGDGAIGSPPLLMLHGSFLTIALWGPLLPALAASRRVVAVELQGHGHTIDADRPFTYGQMADDAAALLRHLGIERADVFGYSLGSGVALEMAIRHSGVVRKLAVASAQFRPDGFYPESRAVIESLTPALFAGTPVEAAYREAAPNPDGFPALVEKLKRMQAEFAGWSDGAMRAIAAPTLVAIGDADLPPEHAVELFRLRGGGVPGDLVGLPVARLAVLPGTTHASLPLRAEWLAPMVAEFLDAPTPTE